MTQVKIVVHGEKELRRDLKRLAREGTWNEGLRPVHKAAADVAVPVARRLGSQPRSNVAGGRARLGSKGLASIRSLASQTSASLAGGGASVPGFGGANYGTRGGRRTRQFPAANKAGYIIEPAIEEAMPQIIETYRKGVDALLKRHF